MIYTNDFFQAVLEGYVNCALWVTFEGSENEDAIFSTSMNKAKLDVKSFLTLAPENTKTIDPQQIGHDLFLTRNRHGAGFWDRYLDEQDTKLKVIAKDLGNTLTEIAENMKESHVFIQDGFIHIE